MSNLNALAISSVITLAAICIAISAYSAGAARVFHGRVISTFRPVVYVAGWKKKVARWGSDPAGR